MPLWGRVILRIGCGRAFWKRELMREITRYRGWLERSRLNSPAVEAKLERALRQLRADHITLAFVGEFSR